MSVFKIKRVYDTPSDEDGVRVLVDRLWPRGLTKEAAAVDFWCKEIAPTSELRTWFDHRQDRFTEFKTRYVAELRGSSAVEELLAQIGRRRTTLVYGAKNPTVNHAVVLADFLAKLPVKLPKPT